MNITRKVIAHAIHAQGSRRSYSAIFDTLAELAAGERVSELQYQVVGIPSVSPIGDGWLIQFAEGTPGVNPIVLNSQSGATRVEPLQRNEVLSEVSHMLVYPRRRVAAIEYVRRGAKAAVMGETIEGILRPRFPDMARLRIEFLPMIGEGFLREIDRFERIRVAEIVVTRPNAGWSDHYDELSDLLEKSDGDTAHLDVRAARGASLSKQSGLIPIVKKITEERQPYLKDAKITGTRAEDASETTVSMQNHLVHTRVGVPADDNGQVDSEALAQRMKHFIRNISEDQ